VRCNLLQAEALAQGEFKSWVNHAPWLAGGLDPAELSVTIPAVHGYDNAIHAVTLANVQGIIHACRYFQAIPSVII